MKSNNTSEKGQNMKNKSVKGIVGITLISIFIMYIVDGIINPGYIYKSIIKIGIFLVLPILYTLYDKNIKLKDNFKIRSKKTLIHAAILGIAIYLGILLVYFVLRNFINLDKIIEILDKSADVDKDNFIWIAIYISFINSLLEEFFFRGFIFLNLRKASGRKSAYIISAFAFSIYHVAIMGSWFNPIIFIVAMIGLFIGGIIFNYLNEKSENIYNSWIVHMMANFAINTVGLIMYGII